MEDIDLDKLLEPGMITIGSKSNKSRQLKKSNEIGKSLNIVVPNNDKSENVVDCMCDYVLNYNGHNIRVIIENDILLFNGDDIGKILNYKNTKKNVLRYVFYDDVRVFDNNKKILRPLKFNDEQVCYVSCAGFISLFKRSVAHEANDFYNWLLSEIYLLQRKKLLHVDIVHKNKFGECQFNEIFKYEGTHDVLFVSDEHAKLLKYTIFRFFEESYDDCVLNNDTSDISGTDVIYLGSVGIVDTVGYDTNVSQNEKIYKFGVTSNIYTRRWSHAANIQKFAMIYVKRTENNYQLERCLKKELVRLGLWRYCRSAKNKYTEFFTVSDIFGLEYVKKYIEDWIESDPTKINIANNLKIKKCDDNALNNVLKYNKYKVHVIYDNGQLWLNGNSVRKLFKYKSLLCITSNIQKNNVKKCREFDNDVLDNNNMLPLHRSFSNTVYISEIGVMSFAILYKLKI